ncbi:bifunctional cobalt-precorrin-7 (C(5))-methyltransferase/cobalt-precorrin-6B (C(15))-methyltransferase [Dermacoccus nishinomiyaensis]|uniref:bifunctional cobalt-precorrin-7 (C(5))-methyltransferase/cobalt-precorrin-6B (C(15))-methyltransferase n=1 Tax=Dermacoccus nishinomiyaensis TaxID=1274 RepID=UPI001643290D|nr:bifunctional cobalt-precorrin-7 (C(5))-methyltransferase CbiE/decarboxylating cobalt-precorrin-6B (C(15))-methyltransferase CbiT [Dermacoccus nishinomiyaensis]
MIEVVGIQDGGWALLPAHLRQLVTDAVVVVGGRRHLELLPQVEGQERLRWPRPLRDGLRELLFHADDHAHGGATSSDAHETYDAASGRVVVLASGDPLRSGVATTLIDEFGAGAVRVHPALSSETLARARMGWAAESVDVVTTVGRGIERVRPFVTPRARLVVLCSDARGPGELAALLVQSGAPEARLTAWWHLGGPGEGSLQATAQGWGDGERDLAEPIPDLVLVCVEVPDELGAADVVGTVPGRTETWFGNDGLITKRDVRAAALARLRPTRGALLWDLGAGSGAVGIEWALAAPDARAVAVERDPVRAERARENARALGVDHRVDVVEATIHDVVAHDVVVHGVQHPDGTAGGPCRDGAARGTSDARDSAPDAVFFGGGLSADAVDAALAALRPGGRLVAHAVTLESESIVLDAWRTHGGDLTRLAVEHLEPLGRLHGWRPARAVVQWSYAKDLT